MAFVTRFPAFVAAAAAAVAFCIPVAKAQALTLDIVGCTSPVVSASGGTISITGCGSSPPPAGAPSCTTTATPNPVSASGGTVTLGVTCSGTANLGAWTTSLSGASISGNTMTVPANTGSSSRAVVATVQACSTDATPVCTNYNAQTTQSGTAPPPPPPGAGLPTSCGTLAVVPFDGGSGNLSYEVRYDVTGMSGSKVAMGTFTTGNAGGATAQFGLADVTGTNAAYRKLYISTTACDFSTAFTVGPTLYPVFRYTVGANPDKSGYKDLLPNTTYYVMAKQESSTGPNCLNGGCGFSLVLHAVVNP